MDFTWDSWIGTVALIAIAVVIAAAAVLAVRLLATLGARRVPWVRDLARRVHRALWVTALIVAVWIACALTAPGEAGSWPGVSRLFLIDTIAAGAWLLA